MTVSVVTPTYNHERFIGPCIRSVLAQTSPDWEMIIVDDGSTDATESIVRSHGDSRIKYLRQDNKGIDRLSETYNAALSMARGETVAILEGDDFWPPYKLALQSKDFEDESVVLSFGQTQVLSSDGRVTGRIPINDLPKAARTNHPLGRAAMYMMSVEFLTYTFPVSVLIRRKTLEDIGGFQQPPYLPLVDYPTFLRLALEGRFVFHPEILGFWRRHDDSVTKNKMYLIYDGVQRHIEEFVRERRLVLPIIPKEYAAIRENWRKHNGFRMHLLGRLCLARGEWADARKAFGKSMALPSGTFRSALNGLGIVLSYSKMTMEPLLRGMGLPDVEKLTGPNKIIDKAMLQDA